MSKHLSNEPHMVQWPGRSQYINLSPIFTTLQEYYQDDYERWISSLDQVIRHISLVPNSEMEALEISRLLLPLYLTKDALNDMFRCNPPRNQGGGVDYPG